MRKRWPHTLWVLGTLAILGAVFALIALWYPFAYIILGVFAVAMIVNAVLDDRKYER
jgi:hypothetical protein